MVLFTLTGAAGVMLAVAVLVILVRAGRDGSSMVPDWYSTVFLPFAVTATVFLATAIAMAPDRRSRAAVVVLLTVTVCVSGLATAWIARSAADDCLTLAPPSGAGLDHLAGISLSPTGTVSCRWDSATGGAPVERTSYRFFDTPPGVSS